MGIIAFLKTVAPVIIFYIGLIVIISLSLRGQIHQALLFLIPLFPLQNVIEKLHQFPLGNQFIDIVLIAMILGWFLRNQSEKDKFLATTPFNKALIIMGVYFYILLWTGSSYLAFPAPVHLNDARLQAWKNFMILPLLYLITVNNIKTIKQIRNLVIAMIVGFFIVDYYTGNQINWMPGLAAREKIDGTFVWAGVNALAAFYAHYIFVFLGLFFICNQKTIKILSAIIVVIGTYIVLFLYSRGSYAGILTGIILIAFVRKKLLLVPIILLIIFWQSILPIKVIERIQQTKGSETGTLDDSSQKRLDIWEKSIQLFKENPIMGVGYIVFPYLGYELGDTHNMYMKVLAEQGIIGMIIFLMLFWLALKSAWRLYKDSSDDLLKGLGLGFLGCIVATMTTNIFGDRWTYLQLAAYFWVFLALVVRGNIITKEQIAKEQVTA